MADVCGQGCKECHEGGNQHRVAENTARSKDFGHAATRQLCHHIAPEEAAQDQVLGWFVPVESSLLQFLHLTQMRNYIKKFVVYLVEL